MTFEQFKSRYLLKLTEQGLASNDIEIIKLYIAVKVFKGFEEKAAKRRG
ncbi:hypothetical protein J7E38_13600 [Bacillus sp. ISL-35]|nr:hypothetical protein [Bacillus sp. ISL-35]MBT2680044.1 hypothetical protein [Bacillus sp. ISL-35]MBT2702979.1 hypothetical protein [Chryseobacterium sp. ISL-80]